MSYLRRYSKKLALYLLLLGLIQHLAVAVEQPDEALEESSVEQATIVKDGERDPFWPVGYWPREATPVVEEKAPSDGWMIEGNFTAEEKKYISEKLKLRGVMERGKRSYAVMANRLAGVGDILKVQVNSRTFELELIRFDGKTVVLAPVTKKEKDSSPAGNGPLTDQDKAKEVPSFRALP